MPHSYDSPPKPENPPCKWLVESGIHAIRTQKNTGEPEPKGGICQHRIGGAVCNAQVYMKPSAIPGLENLKFPSIDDTGPGCLVLLSRDVDI